VNLMKPVQSILKPLAFIGMAVVMVACSVPQAAAQPTLPPAPTVDLPAVHTQVAKTVVAELTVQAALNPTATLPPTTQPTDVPPTLAPTPTEVSVVNTLAPTLPPPATQTAEWRVQPTFTKTPYVDSCVLQSTTPSDGKVINAGSLFDASWVLKNTGMRPWNTSFYFKKVAGTLGGSSVIFVSRSVGTGSEYTFKMDMIAPKTAGNYYGTYKLVNDDGVAICQFYASITVK
jgi:hypothetical protein